MTESRLTQDLATVASPQGRSDPIGGAVLMTLALLTAVAPFGIDLYLPAFPVMKAELSTTATGVQLSLTAFLIGAAIGQVIFGPWSDRAGRLKPLWVGLVVFLAASVTTILTSSIELLVAARLLQGIGGAAGMVIGRAIILDYVRDAAAARALSLVMLITGVAPVVAPLVGGLLVDLIGWRGLLGIVGAVGLVAAVATVLFLRESLPPEVRLARAQARGSGSAWKSLLTRGYLGYAIAGGFGMAIMMAYISASPFVYQAMIGLSSVAYGLAFAANAIGLTLATALSARLVRRFSMRFLVAAGLLISLAATLAILAMASSNVSAAWLMAPLFLSIAPLGLVFGNATALALSAVPQPSVGAASALLGMLQFALAGIVAGLVGVAGEKSVVPLGLTMLAAAVVALFGLVLAGRVAPARA
ncbi:Bicyclomycin resistance protein [compost metagenome]